MTTRNGFQVETKPDCNQWTKPTNSIYLLVEHAIEKQKDETTAVNRYFPEDVNQTKTMDVLMVLFGF